MNHKYYSGNGTFKGAFPRQDYTDWARHVPREINQGCVALATKGKELPHEDLVLEISHSSFQMTTYILARWDGGHDPESVVIGIGFTIDCFDEDDSCTNVATGFGKTKGTFSDRCRDDCISDPRAYSSVSDRRTCEVDNS